MRHRLLLAEENELLLWKLCTVHLELFLFLRQPLVEAQAHPGEVPREATLVK